MVSRACRKKVSVHIIEGARVQYLDSLAAEVQTERMDDHDEKPWCVTEEQERLVESKREPWWDRACVENMAHPERQPQAHGFVIR